MTHNVAKKKILIVEDDRGLNQGLCQALGSIDHEVVSALNLRDARQIINADIDMVVLDINLPDGSGLELLEEIKEARAELPVILLTSNDTDLDIVNGLDRGADDYVTKPFSLAVLRARVNAQIRKLENTGEKKAIEIDGYYFDFDNMIFKCNDYFVQLSKTEQKLLKILVLNQGITISRDRLIDEIWSDGGDFVEENALSVTVKRLRDKLADKVHIKTVYGIGYSWVKSE